MARQNEYDYDFGFSFADSDGSESSKPNEDLKVLQEKIDTIKEAIVDSQSQLVEQKYKAKLKEVENLILPLLYNLMKNPNKAYIKWEGREEIIKKQIEKITAITRS